jgi:adhesin transport system outer membrane protein
LDLKRIFRFSIGSIVKTKNINVLVLSALSLAMAQELAAQSLTETINRAVVDYPSIVAAKFNAESAEYEIDRALGQHMPQIGLQGSANRYDSGGKASREIFTPTVSMNIWSGMKIQSEVERAESLAAAADNQLIGTQDEIVTSAAESYLQWAKSKELLKLAKDNLEVHQGLYDGIKKITDLDPGRRIDLMQAQVRLENAKIAMTSRAAEVKQAGERLNRFWPDVLPEQAVGVDDFKGHLPSSLDEALNIVDQQHPSLATAKSNVEAAEANVGIARSQYHPQINFSGSRQYNWATNSTEFMGQVTANLPVFSGGSIDAATNKALADRQSAQLKLDETRRLLQEKVSVAWDELNVTEQRAELGKQQSEMALQVVSGYKLQFELAKRSLLDLLNVQNDQFSYRSNTIINEYDHRIARFRLSAAMGQLSRAYGGDAVQPVAERSFIGRYVD